MKCGDLLIGIMASLGRPAYGAGELVALARPLGMSESTVRTSISRLSAKGFIESRARAAYAFSEKGAAIARNIAAGFEAPDWSGWDGEYWGAAWSLPEDDKNGRYRIAKKLSLYRFAPLQPGFWIRPRNPGEKMEEKLISLIADPRFKFMAFRLLHPLTRTEAARLWKTDAAGASMRKAAANARRLLARVDSLEPEEAFAARYRTGGMMVDALFSDPLLPPEFLPSDWPARELRDLFRKFDAATARRSRRFWEDAVGEGAKP